jgi:predicted 3-demethylubiquinone-9 3-methyltransferase (glyoxalase superfamily)
MDRYVEVFPGTEVIRLDLTDEGTVQHGEAVIAGQRLRFFDSPVSHAFTFTPALSLFVNVDSAEELDRITEALGADFLMPIGDYGFSKRFAWFNDEFGVSWQISLE